ncbi:hypothetical protein [Lichenibacterium ramalinae]|uniref:DUF4239 domain-containing protein n=1 Tax=Lichenibacterium ramalinae TaxID=2316527 RepID=A0A4Q2R690_9HYPH|nr:hypothetical protein [Lichenibacterium ramalinae]RYB01431.1 hypothetical protein D3272_26255 [Lichenibacterium ramalinae]
MFAFVQSLSLPSLLASLVVALVVASEVGHQLGGRFGRARHRDKDAATLATAAFALLALLIAFTYSMALARYDMRRTVVLDQANALRDAARIAPLLPNDAGAPMLSDLRHEADLAIGLGVPYDPAKFDADMADMADVSARVWKRLDDAAIASPASLQVYRMTGALQALDDATERRVTALRNHVPMTVYTVLVGTALVAMGFAGYGAGAAEASRRFSAAIMALLLACVITMTLDLQRPDRGTVEIPVTPLLDAKRAIPPT